MSGSRQCNNQLREVFPILSVAVLVDMRDARLWTARVLFHIDDTVAHLVISKRERRILSDGLCKEIVALRNPIR